MSHSTLSLQSKFKLASGHEIPRLGFGVAYGFGKDEDPAELTKPSVLEALKVGYRHLDTAQMYGNEALVGEAVRESGIQREDIFITSKVPAGQDPVQGVNDSLKAIGFNYLDLYLIHNPPAGTENRLKMYKGLLEAKAQGKIRDVGVSNFGVRHLEEIKNAGLELPAVNQLEIHPFCQQRPIVDFCRAHNIAIEAYCPIIRGKMDNPIIVELAKKYGKEPAQVLLRWSLQHDFIPLVRSSNPGRILSNTQIYDFVLEDEDVKKLDALDLGAKGAISWNPVNVE
ncbi:Aldo/keto reductase [Panus rudis PR-1116 ss-1]|nr:Aldo/keto reductase [Panus rudis PR-1116 ss-1]